MTNENENVGQDRNKPSSFGAGYRFGSLGLFVVGGLIAFALGEPVAGMSMITAATGMGFSLHAKPETKDDK